MDKGRTHHDTSVETFWPNNDDQLPPRRATAVCTTPLLLLPAPHRAIGHGR